MMKWELLSENSNFRKLISAIMILTASQRLTSSERIGDDTNECDIFHVG